MDGEMATVFFVEPLALACVAEDLPCCVDFCLPLVTAAVVWMVSKAGSLPRSLDSAQVVSYAKKAERSVVVDKRSRGRHCDSYID